MERLGEPVISELPPGKRLANRYQFKRGSDGRMWLEHRLVWTEAYGSIPDGFIVHHRDDDSINNALENLELLPDAVHKSLHSRGQRKLRRESWCPDCGIATQVGSRYPKKRTIRCRKCAWIARREKGVTP